MSEDSGIAGLIEKDICSFSGFSRFPGAGFTGNIQSMLGSHSQNPGIRISDDDGELVISCDIIVYFGVSIPQLCYDIQTKVKKDVESMTGIPVKAVNIRVEGIDRAEDPS